MRKIFFVIATILITVTSAVAQSPGGKKVGFGIMLGDPSGLTAKLWTTPTNAWVFDLGSSYFGSPRIDVDYLWHFNAFNSSVVDLYAGPGGALAFGKGHGFWYNNNGGIYGRANGTALGVRGVFGVNYIPRTTPVEAFFEMGLLIGVTPDFGSAVDAAIGVRYYP